MNSPWNWLQSAETLKHSADLLFAAYLQSRQLLTEDESENEDTKVAGVATLLYGLAMENILKAALLKEGFAEVQTDGRVKWNAEGATGHDLLSMCRSSKLVSLNAEQEKLMERMSAFVFWAGKYPTPLTFKDPKPNKDFKGLLLSGQPQASSVMLPVEFMAEEDKDLFHEIYELFSKRVTDRLKPHIAKVGC